MRFAGELGKEVLYGLLVAEAAFFSLSGAESCGVHCDYAEASVFR